MKDVRPTSGKVLQALMNILAADGKLDGAKFLDLFAGTGHVGLEAMKRGAESCVFVESVKNRADAIKKVAPDSLILSLEVRRAVSWLFKHEMKFNVIFADPPYNSGWCDEILKIPNLEKLFADDCVFILEHSSREKFEINEDSKFEIISTREYGETCLSFVRIA
ncbi:MAG: RsmD family RNA methyltransferase [Synergistaceae bacterium]|nr:RsmD family RNA methyltransferase [Synergistaceae bacterium]